MREFFFLSLLCVSFPDFVLSFFSLLAGSVLSAGMILKSDHIVTVKRLPAFAPGLPEPFLISASPTADLIAQVRAAVLHCYRLIDSILN